MGLYVIWIFTEAYKPFVQYLQQLSHADKDEVGKPTPIGTCLNGMGFVRPIMELGQIRFRYYPNLTYNKYIFFSKIKSNHKFNFSLSPSLYHNHLFILTFIFLFLMKVSFTRSKFLYFSLIWVYFCLNFRTFYYKNGLLVFFVK